MKTTGGGASGEVEPFVAEVGGAIHAATVNASAAAAAMRRRPRNMSVLSRVALCEKALRDDRRVDDVGSAGQP